MTGLAEYPPLNRTRFHDVRTVPETGSTNADLLAAAAEGAAEGVVLVTDHQTAGRGRQSRSWHDEPGTSLLVSVLLRPSLRLAPLLPLLSGVAAVEAVNSVLDDGVAGPGLKWPNDVLAPSLGERKLAGILAESATTAAGSTTATATTSTAAGSVSSPSPDGAGTIVVVVGMGMNLRWGRPPPTQIRSRAATVAELAGRDVARDDVLRSYLRCLEYWLQRVEVEGREVLLNGYRAHCLTIGRTVRFATGSAEYVGRAVDVSSTGTLLMDTADHGRVELHAGDAHHLG